MDPYFTAAINKTQLSLRQVVAQAALAGIAIPAFSAALAFYDGYRSAVLPANLLQVWQYLYQKFYFHFRI